MTAFDATALTLDTARTIGTPILLGALAAGLIASVLQALIQLQEAALGLVARALGVWLVATMIGGELLQHLFALTTQLFAGIGR